MRTAAKVDLNQREIVDSLRAVGVSVQSLASIGKGCPDLLCAKPDGMWLIEVKGPKGKLNPEQQKFIADWRGPVYIARTVDDALKIVGACRQP